jgi:lipid A 4'-phosphatase
VAPLTSLHRVLMNPDAHYRNGFKWVATIIGCLLVFSFVIVQLDLDRKFAGLFFSETKGWHLGFEQPWHFLNQYGTIPGIALSIFALLGYFICQVKDRYRSWRNYFLLIVLTSVLGAGVLVNSVLKPYWGRPRPVQTVDFGGVLEYHPVHVPGEPGRGKSFAGGHSTMGFLFVTLFFFYRRSRTIAYSGLTIGLLAGSLLSIARILQGAHYLSDNIWSLGVILLTSTCLYYFVLRIPMSDQSTVSPLPLKKKVVMGCCVTVIITAMIFFFLTRRPYYSSYQRMFYINPSITDVTIFINEPLEKKSVLYKDIYRARLIIHSHGFGRPAANRTVQINKELNGSSLAIKAKLKRDGFFSELDHEIELWLPSYLEQIADVDIISALTVDQ